MYYRLKFHGAGRAVRLLGAGLGLLVLVACKHEGVAPPVVQVQTPTQSQPQAAAAIVRIQNPEQIVRGDKLFHQYCAACHGGQAVGASNWRERDSDGRFPPPPLNGSAHAWHHPTAQLHNTIKKGGPAGQSNMPGFKDQLSDEQIDDIIAWFKSLWHDELYAAWYAREQKALAYMNQKKN